MKSNYLKLGEQYLFSKVSEEIRAKKGVIDLSVGDVKLPIPSKVAKAGAQAAMELCYDKTFRGYPPSEGYDFFLKAVVRYYSGRVELCEDEIFASDGIKSELSAFLSVFGGKTALPVLTYPAYVEESVLLGNEIVFADFPPKEHTDVVVLCSPSNPTGEILTRERLGEWVRYCLKENAILVFDGAYEAYSDGIRSIFEIEGARECAVEFCSLSKTAGFTGIRCGYTVICKQNPLNAVWRRVKACISNGVSYVTQRMAECALTSALDEVRANIDYYRTNGEILAKALSIPYNGTPYIWYRGGEGAFERFLASGVGVTPGVGFGETGKEYVRINSFCTREDALEAAKRLSALSADPLQNFPKNF